MKKPTLALITCLLAITASFSQATVKTLVLRPGPADGIDADIRTDLPSTPRGSSYDFIANTWTAQGNFFIERGLLKFDLAEIPVSASVISATLYLFTNLNTGHYQLDSGANASWLLRVTEPWQEDQVCWYNQPSFSMTDPVVLPQSVTHTQSYQLDVTAHVSDMVANPSGNYGWLFKLQTEEIFRCMVFASSDNPVVEWRPKLVVQYDVCVDPVAGFTSTVNARTASFTDLSTSATSWYWTFGDGAISNQQNPVHGYATPGIYQVCLEIADSCGTDMHCDTVMISCEMPEAGFQYNFTESTVSFFDTSHCSNPFSWLWDFGDSTFSTVQNPVHEYSQIGSYYVCLTVADSCGRDMVCRYADIIPPLKPGFTSSQNEVTDLEVAFLEQSNGATWWLWDFGDQTTSTQRNPVHLFRNYGTFQVCLTAGNQLAQETSCSQLKVGKVTSMGHGNSILFYPNPYNGNGTAWFVIFEDAGSVTITVTDLEGKVILTREYKDVSGKIPMEFRTDGLVKGVYLIKGSFNKYSRVIKFEVL